MCRWTAYVGPPISLEDLLIKPSHSILNMATEHYLPGYQKQDSSLGISDVLLMARRNHGINTDGFGVGWYEEGEDGKHVAAKVHKFPGWGKLDEQLPALARQHKATVIFAHNRAATAGNHSIPNTHPWSFGRFLFMHNGGIACFSKLKPILLETMGPALASTLEGQTDSEHAFHLLLHFLARDRIDEVAKKGGDIAADLLNYPSTCAQIQEALIKTVRFIILAVDRVCEEAGKKHREHSSLNFVVSDGESMAACRYRDSYSENPPSLYYAHGLMTMTESGGVDFLPIGKVPVVESSSERTLQRLPSAKEAATIVSSEPLISCSDCPDMQVDWKLIPSNHVVGVNRAAHEISITPIKIEPAEIVAKRLVYKLRKSLSSSERDRVLIQA
eukprot:TRINITY_DN20902_c0_g1_i1.p1 TRINITY_DN20902_c0_g1~~TRINITY_DN20902_c0_g1_i1.p1  ORF type:complete len:387 (+),score=76.26 TRINITY_DN20902_c0_g1_i1:129-1289(+)